MVFLKLCDIEFFFSEQNDHDVYIIETAVSLMMYFSVTNHKSEIELNFSIIHIQLLDFTEFTFSMNRPDDFEIKKKSKQFFKLLIINMINTRRWGIVDC